MPQLTLCGPPKSGKTTLANAIAAGVVLPPTLGTACTLRAEGLLSTEHLNMNPEYSGAVAVTFTGDDGKGDTARVASLTEFIRVAKTLCDASIRRVVLTPRTPAPEATLDVCEVAPGTTDVPVNVDVPTDACVVVMERDTFASGRLRKTAEEFGVHPGAAVLARALFYVNVRGAVTPATADDTRALVSNRLGVDASRIFVGDARAALAAAITGTTPCPVSSGAVAALHEALKKIFGSQTSSAHDERSASASAAGPVHRIEADGRFAKSADAAEPDRYMPKTLVERPPPLPDASTSLPARGDSAMPEQSAHRPERYRLKSEGSAAHAAALVEQQRRFTPKSVAA
eukprot:CAMPEP_0174854146 /NCGR_PEP_ID=MMETSP1114-20130205/30178_1 /TAXON_ID=312471 /ORGANISM="Neobodo designis, Strain CCAP 1951/1" /LENGTH=342 /DNA_ID=CAMNT_0016088821 /DNA_START=40 /DNA_END=1068 /DNA_ORIENTATION=-